MLAIIDCNPLCLTCFVENTRCATANSATSLAFANSSEKSYECLILVVSSMFLFVCDRYAIHLNVETDELSC